MEGEIIDGRYRVVALLGKGGMGSVYEAEETSTGRRVAVKVINSHDVSKDRMLVTRFQREAKAAGSIDTDHIARVLDSGVDGAGSPFMVMEFLAGEDLDQVLRRIQPLPPDTAIRITAQACLGLQKAHDAKVVHRDIKPANLFLAKRDDGELIVKLLDFGIAKIKMDSGMSTDSTGLTRTGSMLGSPLYMSPEQARGIKNIDHRTDVWSLGVVLYRMLTGRTPHEDIDALGDLIIAICSDPPRPVQELAPWVPPEIAAVVHGALRFDVTERYQSPADMLAAIRPLLPDGWRLDETKIAPVSDEDRAQVAQRFSISEVSQRRSVIRVGEAAATAPTLDVGTNEGVTQSSTPGQPRGSSKVGMVAGVVALAAAGIFGVYRFKGAQAMPDSQPASLVTPAAPAPPPLSAPEPGAALPATKTVKLVVVPSDAAVEVDGTGVTAKDGVVEVTGTPGSVHKVRIKKAKDEATADVIVTESGASPSKLELAVRGGTVKVEVKPAATAQVRVPPTPEPAKTAAPALPAIKEKFE